MKHLVWALGVLSIAACNNKSATPDAPAAASVTPPAVTAPTVASVATAGAVAPAVAAAPAAVSATDLRYTVTGVAANDVLNVREKPEVSSKKVYSYAPSVKNIRLTGQHQEKNGTPWVEVAFDGGTGWVNRMFLSEMHADGGCNDPEVPALIRAFMKAVTASDGAALKATVSPLRGLMVRPESRALKFPFAQVDTIFTASTVLNLGPGDGGGPDVTGTFKAQIEPSLRASILKKGAQEKCGKVLTGSSTSAPPQLETFSGTPVSFFYPGEPNNGGNDWVTWIGSIEYVDGKPYFFELDRYQWSI